MPILKTLRVAVAAALLATTAHAGEDIMVKDAYARVSSPAAKSGGAFMMVHNMGGTDDRLIGVSAEIAAKAELHTHVENDEGVMQMLHVEEGFALPAGEALMLKRGDKHVMLMGLTQRLDHGDVISLTLVFENAGEMQIEVPVDLHRKGGGHDH